jgi:hypothetical protein
MPANTKLKIVSRANILIGGDPIPALDSSTAEAIVGETMYEDIVRDALLNTRWRFATAQDVVTRTGVTPLGRWDSEYDKPSDCLMINAITINDVPIHYDVYGEYIYCNAVSTDTVIMDYILRPDEKYWPAYFTLAVEFLLAGVMAISIARDDKLASLLEQKSERQLYKARRLDSQQQTTRRLDTSEFLRQRLS